MEKKTVLITLSFLAILICSMAASVLIENVANAAKAAYNSTYMTVSGVLATDSYVLFPYEKKNLTIGFSKYGEMVDYDTKVGLNYTTTDPFAPGEARVTEAQWVEGWIINITFVEGGYYRNTWARATYSDYYDASGIGGDWKEGCTDGSTGLTNRGGRKTSGGAVTDPIKVLYDGPRRFVALLNTAIYKEATHSTPLVNITFTILFNKDKKQVIIYKDIKRTDVGKNIGDMQIEFSNRGEWDLGNGNPPKSYAHFYLDQPTLYNGHYQAWYNTTDDNYNSTYTVCQMVDDEELFVGWAAYWPKPILSWVGATQIEATRTIILSSMTTKTQVQNGTGSADHSLTETPTNYPQKNASGIFWKEEPMVFVNDRWKVINGSTPADMVYYFEGNNTVKFPAGYIPSTTDIIKIIYKYKTHERTDMGSEPNSPFVIGEWAFKMYEAKEMFRAVTIYGVADRHDGDDSARTGGSNVLDAEIQYYLNETFNPFDLYSAVHKQEYRWVNITTLSSARTYYQLRTGLDDHIYYVNASSELTRLGWTSPGWTGYYFRNNTANATGTWLNEYEDGVDAHSKNWLAFMNATYQSGRESEKDQEEMLKITPTGYGPLGTLRFSDLVDFSFWYKTLYTSGNSTFQAPGIEIKLYNQSNGAYFATLKQFDNYNATGSWQQYTLNNIDWFLHSGYNADNAWYVSTGATIANDCDGNAITTGAGGAHSYEWWNKRLRGFYVAFVAVDLWNGAAYVDDVDIAYLDKTSGIRYRRVYNMEEDKLYPSDWTDYCTFAERVLINNTLAIPYRANSTFGYYNYTIDFENGNITFVQSLSAGTHLKILYSTIEENEKGRYEWIVVGKDAATIDSLGAAYMTEAFDSTKDISVLMAGQDINATLYGPYAPFVMGGAGTGTKADYRDSLGRTHLRDDWCNTTAIASSNMMFSGGPRANMGAEYFNEFTMAFFARSEYVTNDTGHSNKIVPLSCWNKTHSRGSGYAAISVYKDLNGTIGFLIWGYDGQDTYYAAKWFWSIPAGTTAPDGTTVYSGIEYLQHENRGVTDIILRITYPTADPIHPTFSVVEHLGTISEKDQHDP